MAHDLVTELLQYSSLACFMPIWQLCANLLIPNCLRSNLSYFPLAALELYVNESNSVMVLYFIDQYIHNNCDIPRDMIEDNIRVDYNKLRMLIRHDKEFAHDASIIQHLVTDGFVTGTLKRGFPAESINDPDNFVSLLFYFGMLTIDGTYRGKTKFVIPNEVVREQIYAYLLEG